MNTLRNLHTTPNFSREELQGLDASDLAQLEQYTPGVTQLRGKNLIALVRGRTPNIADIVMISEIRQAKKAGTLLGCGQFEELTWSKGGQVVYAPEKITLELTGKTVEIANSPIPTMVVCDREGFDMIRVQVCAFFALSKGVVVRIMPESEWNNRFGWEGSHVKVTGIAAFEAGVKEVLSSHPLYASYVDTQKTLSGRDMFQFIAESLKLCPMSNYIALHDIYVVLMLDAVNVVADKGQVRVFRKMQIRLNGESKHVIPPTSYTQIRGPDAVEFHKMMNRFPFALVGPLPTAHKFYSPTKATLETAIKAVAAGNSLRGGHSQGIGLMVASYGFSGMQSKRVRYLSMIAALALPIMLKGTAVDVRVEPQDIPPLALTFQYHCPSADVRYVVSSIHLASLSSYEHLASLAPRAEAVFVMVDDEVIPSVSAKKDATAVWKSDGAKKLTRWFNASPRFVCVCAILSEEYFDKFRVYSHSLPAEFEGIVTSLPDLELKGVENGVLVPIKLERVKTWAEMLEAVVQANIKYNTFFLAPQTFYSPLANILVSPKSHMKFEIGDAGEWLWGKMPKNASFLSPTFRRHEDGDEVDQAVVPAQPSLLTGYDVTASSRYSVLASTAQQQSTAPPSHRVIRTIAAVPPGSPHSTVSGGVLATSTLVSGGGSTLSGQIYTVPPAEEEEEIIG